jgi:microcystin-dependent protein
MASTYSNLKIQLMATGENNSTWGTVTNTNLGTAIEEAIVGSADVTFASGNVTLTLTNTNATQTARNLRLNLTGTTGGARDLVVPAIEKVYIINNGCADAVTVKNTTGSGIAVPAGKTMYVYNNGTDVIDAITHLSSLTLATPLAASQGGTGITSVGTSGNVLTSTGSAWISQNPFVTGMIMLWSGSIATIPTGWALCNGSSGTPDLRDRFIVGAGSTYAVNATGGSATTTLAEVNLPSHTHSFSASATTGNQSVDHSHTFSGTTSGQSVTHTHTATSSVTDPGHTHSGNVGSTTFNPGGGGGLISPYDNTSIGTATTGISVSTSIGNASVDHTHTYSGTTSGVSANHNHSVSISGTTGATGSGTAFNNLPPYYALAYIMKL